MNSNLLNRTIEKINWEESIICLLAFLILPPFIGIPLSISMIWRKKNASKTDYYTFFICIATYFAAINATKSPLGDQINYTWAYLNVPKQGFIGSLKNIYGYATAMGEKGVENISGEFMNGVYNYVGYYLTFGYYPLFAALITFADYFLIFVGLYKFAQSLRKPHIPIVCGVLILSFFYLFFNFTLHIQKQFLAQSIIMYVLGSYANTGKMTKKLWITTLIACFTHASIFLFIPFLVYKPFHEVLTKTRLSLLIGLSFIFVLLGPSIAGSMNEGIGDSTLSYGVKRLASSETHNDTQFGLVWSQVYVIAFPIGIITLRKLWLERCNLDKKTAFILNIVLFLLVAIIGMYRQPLAQYRYFMMLFAFMPFVYPFIFEKIKKRDLFLKSLSVIMIIWFYLQFEKIIWHYADEWEIIFKPPMILIWDGYKII